MTVPAGGLTYRERGAMVVVRARGSGPGPRNALVERGDGTVVVRPFRGLRRPPEAEARWIPEIETWVVHSPAWTSRGSVVDSDEPEPRRLIVLRDPADEKALLHEIVHRIVEDARQTSALADDEQEDLVRRIEGTLWAIGYRRST